MEVMQLLAMFRGTIPKDRKKMDLFLRYQAQHFDEKWQDLVESFLTEEGNTQSFSKSNLAHCLLTVDFKTLFSNP